MNITQTHITKLSGITNLSFKQIGAAILATALAVSGAGFGEKTEAWAETENQEPAMMATCAMLS